MLDIKEYGRWIQIIRWFTENCFGYFKDQWCHREHLEFILELKVSGETLFLLKNWGVTSIYESNRCIVKMCITVAVTSH